MTRSSAALVAACAAVVGVGLTALARGVPPVKVAEGATVKVPLKFSVSRIAGCDCAAPNPDRPRDGCVKATLSDTLQELVLEGVAKGRCTLSVTGQEGDSASIAVQVVSGKPPVPATGGADAGTGTPNLSGTRDAGR